MHVWMEGRVDERMHECMPGSVDEWMNNALAASLGFPCPLELGLERNLLNELHALFDLRVMKAGP